MDKKTIEEVLGKIIDIDKKSVAYSHEVADRIEQEKQLLKKKIADKKQKYDELMEVEGKKIYNEILFEAGVAAEDIYSDFQDEKEKMEMLMKESKEKVKDEIMHEIFHINGKENV